MLRLTCLLTLLCATTLLAGPLQEARINRIVNDVRIVDPKAGVHAAALQDVVKNDLGVKTGQKSRAELLFQDETLTRLGADTFFSFQPGTRDLTLEQGTMLLQVPKGVGGAKIRTAAVTAAITGTTIMIEYFPGKLVKVLVLEGSLRLSLNGRLGESVTLTPGRMLMMKPGDKRLPEPVDVDLARLVKTSPLISGDFKKKDPRDSTILPSHELIAAEIRKQEIVKGKAGLVETNLIIQGNGNDVKIASREEIASLGDSGAVEKTRPATLVNHILTEERTDAGNGQSPIVGSGGSAQMDDPLVTLAELEKFLNELIATNQASDSEPTESNDSSEDSSNGTTVTPVVVVATPATTTLATIAIPNPYVVTKRTVFDLQNGTIITGSRAGTGAYFYHLTEPLSPADYLFGSTSATDTTFQLNATFGLRDTGTPPANGVAVFRFNGLRLQEMKDMTGAATRPDLALVSLNGITSQSAVKDLEFTGLHTLFLGAQAGDILLSNKLKSSDLKALDLYSRSGKVTLNGELDLANTRLYINSAGSITLNNKAKVKQANLFALGNIAINSEFTADSLTLQGAAISLGNSVSAPVLNVSGDSVSFASSYVVTSGTLSLGAGGIFAPGKSLSGFSSIATPGNVSARSLNTTGALQIGGKLDLGTNGGTSGLTAASFEISQGIAGRGANDSGAAGFDLTLDSPSVLISSGTGGINGINLEGANRTAALTNDAGRGGSLTIGTAGTPLSGNVTINAPVSTASGDTVSGPANGGDGGTVSMVTNGQITVDSTVRVSSSEVGRESKKGGTIQFASNKTTGPAITVNNSGQLLSLLAAAAVGPGGKIEFSSAGGDILVNGATVQADRGLVDIRNNGNGNITLNNANLRGDTVKVGAFGPNGQLLIGGGSINADTTIKLYAPGANGTVRFTENTTLSSTSAKTIAANAVTIDNAKQVQIVGGKVNVYTNQPNFTGNGGNGSTTGNFTGTVSLFGLGSAPGY